MHYLQRNRSGPINVHHVAVPTENNLTIEDDVIDLTNVEDDDGNSSKHNADIENQIQGYPSPSQLFGTYISFNFFNLYIFPTKMVGCQYLTTYAF